jgi:phosphonate transport system substrate-binding protein
MAMIKKRLFALLCASVLLTLGEVPTGGKADSATRTDVGREIVVGRATDRPDKDYRKLKQLADYLAPRLREFGIAGARVQLAEDHETMKKLLREGRVDVVSETVFSALIYAEQTGAELLLREWRDGVPTYHTVLFARRDSSIAGPLDLLGKTIAFEDPGSTSAYFVPRAELQSAGLRLVELADFQRGPPPDAVGYLFASSEEKILEWVFQRRVQAGAFSNIDWDQAEDLPPRMKKELAVFHRSAELPRAVVLVRRDVPEALKQQIKEVLLAAHTAALQALQEDPQGRTAIQAYRDVPKYDELVGEAAAGIAAARELLAQSALSASERGR